MLANSDTDDSLCFKGKSKLQDVMREKQTPVCDSFFFFFLSPRDLIWFEVPVCAKAHYSKGNVKKMEYLDEANSCEQSQ